MVAKEYEVFADAPFPSNSFLLFGLTYQESPLLHLPNPGWASNALESTSQVV